MRNIAIQTRNQVECREIVNYLHQMGYGKKEPQSINYPEDYPHYLHIILHDEGRKINTCSNVVSGGLYGQDLLVFKSARHFLTSNQNVDIGGNPMAARFI